MIRLVPYKVEDFKGDESLLEKFLEGFYDDKYVGHFNSGLKFKADIKDEKDKYVVEAELPGVDKKDISVEYIDKHLIISGSREESVNEEKNNYIRKERHHGEFSRVFYVDNIKEDEINAKFDNGILTIELPKSENPKDNTKKIEIK